MLKKHQNYFYLFLLTLLFLFPSSLLAKGKVIAYVEDFRDMTYLKTLDFSQLTTVIYSVYMVNDDGSLQNPIIQEVMDTLVSRGRAADVEILIAFGGGSYGDNDPDVQMTSVTSNPAYQSRFIKELMQVVRENELDGIDNDWEPFTNPHLKTVQFTGLMKVLRDSLDAYSKEVGKKKILSCAIHPAVSPAISAESIAYADFLSTMSYFKGSTAPAQVAAEMDFWEEKGVPREKLVAGIAFFCDDMIHLYKQIIAADPMGYTKSNHPEWGNYNNPSIVQKITEWAWNNDNDGVMFWAMHHDTQDEHSLLKAIADKTDALKAAQKNPTVFITAGPKGQTLEKRPLFQWRGEDYDGEVSHYFYSFDDPTPNKKATSTSFTPDEDLSDGPHTFYIQAVDNEGYSSQVRSRAFYVGETPKYNLIKNGTFSQVSDWAIHEHNYDPIFATTNGVIENGEYKVSPISAGTALNHVGVKQVNISLEMGKTYRLTYDAYATKSRPIVWGLEKADSPWTYYAGTEHSLLTNRDRYGHTITMNEASDKNALFFFGCGKNSEAVLFDNVALTEIDSLNYLANGNFTEKDEHWYHANHISEGASSSISYSGNSCTITPNSSGSEYYHINIGQRGIVLQSGKTYKVSFTAKANSPRAVSWVAQENRGDWTTYGSGVIQLSTESKEYTETFTMSETDSVATLFIGCGKELPAVTIESITLREVVKTSTDSVDFNMNHLQRPILAPNPVSISDGELSLYLPDSTQGVLELIIYDHVGNEIIRKPIDSASENSYVWDLKNRHGMTVTPGSYVAIMRHKDTLERIRIYGQIIGIKK